MTAEPKQAARQAAVLQPAGSRRRRQRENANFKPPFHNSPPNWPTTTTVLTAHHAAQICFIPLAHCGKPPTRRHASAPRDCQRLPAAAHFRRRRRRTNAHAKVVVVAIFVLRLDVATLLVLLGYHFIQPWIARLHEHCSVRRCEFPLFCFASPGNPALVKPISQSSHNQCPNVEYFMTTIKKQKKQTRHSRKLWYDCGVRAL